MLGCFPDPYSDELLYSVCARLYERMQFPNKQSIGEELFGTKECKAIADLPCHLDYLVSNLPFGHCYTTDYLIDNHTLLPFYGLFLPADRLLMVREAMRKSNAVGIHHWAGINRNAVKRPDWLRFCPLCVSEDKENFGECYWHCGHQLPGIYVCVTHQIILEESNVRLRDSGDRYMYFAAEQAIYAARPRFLDVSSQTDAVLLNLAHSSLWLLEHPSFSTDLQSIQNKYMSILAQRGLVSPSGRVYAERLLEAFNNHYPSDVLLQCHSQISIKRAWILSILKPGRAVQSPIRHILFINFLGLTVEEFFELKADDQVIGGIRRRLSDEHLNRFGEGPWPCLNLTHRLGYMQLIIKQFDITHNTKGQVVGIFSCECGFTYRRVGPDASHADRFRYDSVRSYGSVWEASLLALLSAPEGNASKAARELGVTYRVARRYAAKLGFLSPFPSENTAKLKDVQQEPPDLLSLYRRKLLDTIEEAGADFSRTLLRGKIPTAYYYLYTNDSKWLENHLPPPRKRGANKSYVNWEEIDILLAPKIRLLAKLLRKAPGRPRRVSKSALARESGHTSAIYHHLTQLPLTTAALADVEESREDYAIRRIRWAAGCYREEEVYPARWQLLNRAGLRPEVAVLPRVSSELDAVWESLHPLHRTSRAKVTLKALRHTG
jgi:hypothetical protein